MWTALGLAMLIGVVVGCTDVDDDDLSGVEVATYQGEPTGFTAASAGVLVVIDGCVHLEAEHQGLVLPVFPADVERDWVAELGFAGEDAETGEPVVLGGGEGDLDNFDAEVPTGCDTSAQTWIVGDVHEP